MRLKVEGDGGRIEHSELVYGEALVMVGQRRQAQTPEGSAWRESTLDRRSEYPVSDAVR